MVPPTQNTRTHIKPTQAFGLFPSLCAFFLEQQPLLRVKRILLDRVIFLFYYTLEAMNIAFVGYVTFIFFYSGSSRNIGILHDVRIEIIIYDGQIICFF